MARRTTRAGGPEDAPDVDEVDHGPGLIGAAVRAPLTQGRDGSFPVELEGDDLAEPHLSTEVRGEPTEPVLHAPTTTHIEPRPIATGECTVETMERVPLCEDEEG